MTTQNENPTFPEVIRDAIRSELLDLHVSLPARIESYDPLTQKAKIKPLLKKKYLGASPGKVDLPVISNVPVQWPSSSAGKTFIHLPLKKGDIGIALFCERSLDKYLSSQGEVVSPEDPRIHDISDAFFIPGARPFPLALTNVNDSDIIIQNDVFRIELSPEGKISLTGAGGQELLTILDSLIQNLIDAKVITALGPQPFIASTTVALTVNKTNLEKIKK